LVSASNWLSSAPDEPVVPSQPDLVVYLVRHGRCALNAEGVLRGRLDPDLDEVGRSQAHALAERLKEVPIDRIVSSPLLRARRTADALAATTGAEVEVEGAWADRDYGPWAGHRPDDVAALFGSVDAAPGVEPRAAFNARALEAARALARSASPTSVVAVVSHDAVLRAVLAGLVAELPDDPDAIELSTGSSSRLELRDGSWRVTDLNTPPEGPGGAARVSSGPRS